MINDIKIPDCKFNTQHGSSVCYSELAPFGSICVTAQEYIIECEYT